MMMEVRNGRRLDGRKWDGRYGRREWKELKEAMDGRNGGKE